MIKRSISVLLVLCLCLSLSACGMGDIYGSIYDVLLDELYYGQDYDYYDYIIGMDDGNMNDMHRMLGGDPDAKLIKLLTLCGDPSDVADPWYTGDFEATWQDVNRGCAALLEKLKQEL